MLLHPLTVKYLRLTDNLALVDKVESSEDIKKLEEEELLRQEHRILKKRMHLASIETQKWEDKTQKVRVESEAVQKSTVWTCPGFGSSELLSAPDEACPEAEKKGSDSPDDEGTRGKKRGWQEWEEPRRMNP